MLSKADVPIGSKVKILEDNSAPGHLVGTIGMVVSYDSSDDGIEVQFSDGDAWFYGYNQVELIEPFTKAKAKMGDRVLIIKGDEFVIADKGKYAQVVKVHSSPDYGYTIQVKVEDSGTGWSLREEDYEVVSDTKFKVGDQVKVVKANSAPAKYIGQTGRVGSIGDSYDTSISVKFDDSTIWYYSSTHLEKVTKAAKVKVGDKIRIINGDISAIKEMAGKIVTVASIPSPSWGYAVRFLDDDGSTPGLREEDFELVESPKDVETNTTLDPRVVAYMHASTLEPEALIEDKIKLAEWLMK